MISPDQQSARRRFALIASAAVLLTASFAPTIVRAIDPAALLVVGNPSALGPGDIAVRNRLVTLGFAVTLADDGTVNAASTTSAAVVLVSASSSSGAIGTRLTAVAVPLIVWEGALYDDLGMGAAGAKQIGQTQLTVSGGGHPLTAGLSGTQTVASAAGEFWWGGPNANAIVGATYLGNPSRPAIFGYEAGVAMPGRTAPARRVGLFLLDNTAASLTTAGGALFDAAVTWAAGTTGPTPTPTPAPTATPAATATPSPTGTTNVALLVVGNPSALGPGDIAVRNRLVTLGFAVTLADDGTVNAASTTSAAVVLVSASSSSGAIGTRLTAVAVPLIVWEGALYDDLGMGAAGAKQIGQTQLTVSGGGHPLTAGLSGTQTVASAAGEFWWGGPNANAIVGATYLGNPSRPAIFGYEAGVAMPGRTAPARRVGLFLLDNTAASLTTAGGALFDAAVTWAAGTTGPTPTPTPAPTATPAATATPSPTGTPAATATPAPTATPVPTSTPTSPNDADGDGVLDCCDAFALDSTNGTTGSLFHLEFTGGFAPGQLLEDAGFTGVMSNNVESFRDLYDEGNVNVTGGRLSLDATTIGDAVDARNDQEYAFLRGFVAPAGVFTVYSEVCKPYPPANFQSFGIFLGTGDQDNFIKAVVDRADSARAVHDTREVDGDGFGISMKKDGARIDAAPCLGLKITVTPSTLTYAPGYSLDGGSTWLTFGGDQTRRTLPASWFQGDRVLALGIISTRVKASNPSFSATWENVGVILGTEP